MKHKILFGVAGIFFVFSMLFGGLGCATSGSAQQDPFVRTSVLDAYKSTLTAEFNKYVTKDTFDAWKASLSSSNAYTKSETYSKTEVYTRAEVDKIVSDAISNLKSNQAWITGSSSSGGTGGGGGTSGAVTFTTNPASVPQIFTSTTGGQQVFYTMHIMNGTATWQYVKPIITLSIASSYSARTIGAVTISMSGGSCSFSQQFTTTSNGLTPPTYTVPVYNPASPQQINISPNTLYATATPSIVLMPVAGCTGSGEFQLGAGQAMDVLINISNFTTSDVTLWNVSNSISSRSL
jgi:hypothetical protein